MTKYDMNRFTEWKTVSLDHGDIVPGGMELSSNPFSCVSDPHYTERTLCSIRNNVPPRVSLAILFLYIHIFIRSSQEKHFYIKNTC